jgi:hypothetical protein
LSYNGRLSTLPRYRAKQRGDYENQRDIADDISYYRVHFHLIPEGFRRPRSSTLASASASAKAIEGNQVPGLESNGHHEGSHVKSSAAGQSYSASAEGRRMISMWKDRRSSELSGSAERWR